MSTLEDFQDEAIACARDELAENGMVSVTTFIALGNLGLDALSIVNQLEEEA